MVPFCAAKPPAWPATIGYAVVGPRRAETEAALAAAFESVRKLTGLHAEVSRTPNLLIAYVSPGSSEAGIAGVIEAASNLDQAKLLCGYAPSAVRRAAELSKRGEIDNDYFICISHFADNTSENVVGEVYDFLRIKPLLTEPAQLDADGISSYRVLKTWIAPAK